MNNSVIRNLVVLLWGLVLLSCKTSNAIQYNSHKKTPEKLPNLIIVLSDQHSYDMVGAYGNEQIITPNLDKLASEGVLINNAFSSMPVCTPFRGMLMSGMHPFKNGAFQNHVPLLPNKTKLLGEILKEKGYQTAYVGKWHLAGGAKDTPVPKDLRYGFETVLTYNSFTDFRVGKSFYWNDNDEKVYFKEWEPYAQTNQVIDYLQHIDKSKPFAIILSYNPPHNWGRFIGVDGKPHFRYDTLDELTGLYQRDSLKLRPGLEDTPDRRKIYHTYMAQVTGVDKAFGRLTKHLKIMNIEDNTIIAFSADHGDMLESHDATLPKQYPQDYSTRIPFIIKYPKKIKAGVESETLLGTMDILPTLLGFMDIETNLNFDGKDLSKKIVSNELEEDDYTPIWCYRIGDAQKINWRGVVTKDYTFSMDRYKNPITNVLFDRKNDPHQLHNLYYKPEYNTIRTKLEKLTLTWMKKYEDQFYGADEFKTIQPNKEKWKFNYTKNIIELFAEKENVQK